MNRCSNRKSPFSSNIDEEYRMLPPSMRPKEQVSCLSSLTDLGPDDKFGFIVMDELTTFFYILCGNKRRSFSVYTNEHTELQYYQLEYDQQVGIEMRLDYVRKTAEYSTWLFMNRGTSQPDVAGLILAGPGDLKREMYESDMFDARLKSKVLNIVDTSCGGLDGFDLAIEMSLGILCNVKFVQEISLLKYFINEMYHKTGKCVIRVGNTLRALEMGAVETLVMWDKLDINRYKLKNSASGETIIKYMNRAQESDEGNFVDPLSGAELEVEEKIRLLDWLVSNYDKAGCTIELITINSQQGSQFCMAFGGIGGILRYKLDPKSFEKRPIKEVYQTST